MRHRGRLHCIDSICYHAAGPLGLGDIEDIEDRPAIICPWHMYRVTLDTGEKLYRGIEMHADGTRTPTGWQSAGVKQRVHAIVEREGKIFVVLSSSGSSGSSSSSSSIDDRGEQQWIESDKFACRAPDADRSSFCASVRSGCAPPAL